MPGAVWPVAAVNYLDAQNILVAPSINCTDCIDCGTATDMESDFNANYPYAAAGRTYDEMLANYFNAQLGWQLGPLQYNGYLDDCVNGSGTPVECDPPSTLAIEMATVLNDLAANMQLLTDISSAFDL